MKKCMAGALTLALALALAGCAGPPRKHSSLPETVSAAEGIVSVKVIGVQRLSASNAKWGTLKLTEVATGRHAELRDTAPFSAGYSPFMGPLPPGQYKVNGLHTEGSAPATFGLIPALIIMGMTSDSQSLGSQLGSFTVKAGTLTNLGVVVSALPDDKSGSFKLAVLADDAGVASVLDDIEPESLARLKTMPRAGWDQPQDPRASATALDIVRTHASNVSSLEILDGGGLAIGSALGMVHIRDKDGRWTSTSTGSLDNITTVRSLPAGGMFAGADSGRYHVWNAGRGTWRSHTAASGERVVSMEPMGAAGYALMTQAAQPAPILLPGRSKVLFKQELDSPEAPRTVLELEGGSAMALSPMVHSGKDLLVVFNHVGFTRTADVYRVDQGTLQHKLEKADHWTRTFYRLPDGGLVRERMNGMSIYTDFSSDGITWARNEASGPNAVHFTDRLRGYGTATQSTGWSSVTMALQKTTDGGKQWAKVGRPFEATGLTTVRVAGDTVFVFTGKQLLSTRDEGQTWATEWPRPAAP